MNKGELLITRLIGATVATDDVPRGYMRVTIGAPFNIEHIVPRGKPVAITAEVDEPHHTTTDYVLHVHRRSIHLTKRDTPPIDTPHAPNDTETLPAETER